MKKVPRQGDLTLVAELGGVRTRANHGELRGVEESFNRFGSHLDHRQMNRSLKNNGLMWYVWWKF